MVQFDSVKKIKVIKTIKKSKLDSFSIHNDGEEGDVKHFNDNERAAAVMNSI